MKRYKKLLKTIGARLYEQKQENRKRLKGLYNRSSRQDYLSCFVTTSKISVEDLYNLLNSIFGDNWEVTTEYLIVKYDSVVVTNDNGDTHTIRDLYIRYDWKNRVISPQAYKSTYTFGELQTGYLHSHIKCKMEYSEYKKNFKEWSGIFCFGDYITNVLQVVRQRRNYVTDYLYMFISIIHEWLKEESTHTSPYASIHNITQERDIRYVVPNIEVSDIDTSSLEIYGVQNITELAVSANTIELIENHPNYSSFLCYTTKYYNYALDSKAKEEVPIEIPNKDFYFRKKRVIFRVLNEDTSLLTPVIHPRVIDQFNQKINEYVRSFKEEITKNYLELYSKNREEGVESASILLSADS